MLDNAFKFMHLGGGTVTMNVFEKDAHVLCEIQDTGCGISAEDIPRVFLRFFRGDRSRATQGNGLGLSLVQAFVKAHSGSVIVKSVLNKGTIVILSFPKLLQ
ncbi:MAG: ATP-binding protein [Candidatus Omnitrophica bacterium]|nr:ATP-binding protein [Candidatus Omnitrophota bacterium]